MKVHFRHPGGQTIQKAEDHLQPHRAGIAKPEDEVVRVNFRLPDFFLSRLTQGRRKSQEAILPAEQETDHDLAGS